MTPRQMLLISGPSGGGKSTLIRQISNGTLPPNILSRLPAGAGTWQVLEANDILKGDASLESLLNPASTANGFLIHYDIVFIHTRGIQSYEDDPSMRLLHESLPLDVIFVKPDQAAVRAQFLARRNRQMKKKSRASRLWGSFVRQPLRRFVSRLTRKQRISTAELYAQDKWLPQCYAQWEAFVHKLPGSRMIVVTPETGPDGSETFLLVRDTGEPVAK